MFYSRNIVVGCALQTQYVYGLKCDHCDEEFATAIALKTHVRFSHDASGDGDAFCPFCYRAGFNSFKAYVIHHNYCQQKLQDLIDRRVRSRGLQCRDAYERAAMLDGLKIPHSLDAIRRSNQGVSIESIYMYEVVYSNQTESTCDR